MTEPSSRWSGRLNAAADALLDELSESPLPGARYARDVVRRRLPAIEEQARAEAARLALEEVAERVRAVLTSEDEIAHGEAYEPSRGGLGFCAYDDEDWPCRTQRGIERVLALLDAER